MNLLSNVFSTARKEWLWISESPAKDARQQKESPPRSKLIVDGEIEAICHALDWRHDERARNEVPVHRLGLPVGD